MTQEFQYQCPMLWINDLLSMPNHPLVSKAFLFRNLKIKEVAVFGLITSVERMKSAITYYVDDGTGVILCAYDETCAVSHHKEEAIRLLDFYRDPENTYEGSNAALMWMLERAIDVYDQDYTLQEGDSVHIIGVMSQCTEELRVITISFICPLRDLKSEIIMMELRTHFYKNMCKRREKVELTERSNSINSCESSPNYEESGSYENGGIVFEGLVTRRANHEKAYTYMGEWHEEYFMHSEENYCDVEVCSSDDLIPD